MERSNTIKRKKRSTGNVGEGGQQQKSKKKKKVPEIASVSDKASKEDGGQNISICKETLVGLVREAVEQVGKKFKQEVKRQVEKKVKQEVKRVKQDVKRALANSGIVIYGERSPPKQIEGPDGRNLQLRFRSRLSLPLFTEVKVEGEQDAAIYVVLIDKNTGNPVTSGPESSAKLEVVVLEGDFNNEDDDDWTREDFESQVVKVREGKRPILIGDLKVSLKEGVGSLGEFTFTDNSSWTRSKKFRLGAKVASDFCEGIRIREAKTDAFKVKDHRGKSYEKRYPPELGDEVWRLEKIHKNGAFHKRLNKAKVHNVQDFLRLLVTDSGRLREILQKSMSDMKWNILEKHARTCVLSKTQYVYYTDDTKTTGVIFNIIYELTGLIADGKYYSAETLSDSQKVFVDTLVKKAYDNWMHVIEYDGRMLLNMKQSKIASSSQTKVTIEAPEDYPISFDQQVSLPCLPSSVPSEQAFMNPGLAVGGGMWYDDNFGNRYPAHSQHSNAQMQLKRSSFERQIQHINSSDQSQIKAVVGWLKLKAALRWGIFIRKKAAEKRELFELEVFLGLMCEPGDI